jgi:hypothetical protein
LDKIAVSCARVEETGRVLDRRLIVLTRLRRADIGPDKIAVYPSLAGKTALASDLRLVVLTMVGWADIGLGEMASVFMRDERSTTGMILKETSGWVADAPQSCVLP